MNPDDNKLQNDFRTERRKKDSLINPRLVDPVAQAERETRAIEEKSKAIRAQHTSTTTASPVGEIVLPNYGGECLPFKSPTK